MDTEVEERIRARAYQFWVDEGWPSGRELDHWIRAVEAVAAEEGRAVSIGGQAAVQADGAAPPGAEAEVRAADPADAASPSKARKTPTRRKAT